MRINRAGEGADKAAKTDPCKVRTYAKRPSGLCRVLPLTIVRRPSLVWQIVVHGVFQGRISLAYDSLFRVVLTALYPKWAG